MARASTRRGEIASGHAQRFLANKGRRRKREGANTARRHRHVGGLGGSAGDGEGGESRGQDCRGSRPGGAGHHGTIEKVGRRRLASQRSSCARGKLEASRGQWRPLVPPYPHRGSNRWLSQQGGSVFATALFVAAGFAGRPTGGIYRPGWCCIAAPMPRPPHLASLACSWRMASLVLASCGLGERCQRAGCVAVAVLLAEWRARGSCITTRLHLNLPQS